MITIPNIPESVVVKHGSKAWPLGLAGAGLLIIGSLLSWCFDPQVLGNLSISLNPGGLQIMAIALALLAVILLLAHQGPLTALGQWADTALALRALATWALLFMTVVLVAITVEAGGLVNIEPGGWISLAAGSRSSERCCSLPPHDWSCPRKPATLPKPGFLAGPRSWSSSSLWRQSFSGRLTPWV